MAMVKVTSARTTRAMAMKADQTSDGRATTKTVGVKISAADEATTDAAGTTVDARIARFEDMSVISMIGPGAS